MRMLPHQATQGTQALPSPNRRRTSPLPAGSDLPNFSLSSQRSFFLFISRCPFPSRVTLLSILCSPPPPTYSTSFLPSLTALLEPQCPNECRVPCIELIT